jgi:hypothetical protein
MGLICFAATGGIAQVDPIGCLVKGYLASRPYIPIQLLVVQGSIQ